MAPRSGFQPPQGNLLNVAAKPVGMPTSNASTAPSMRKLFDQQLLTRFDDVREAAYWWMLE